MGLIDDFLIALEAEDITEEAKSLTDKATGNKEEKRDINQTENIFGGEETSNQEEEDTNPENNADNNDLTDEGNEDDEDLGDEDADISEDDSSLDDDLGEDNVNQDSEENETEMEQKERLLENMITLYNIIENNIQILSNYSPESSNPDLSKTLHNLTSNLRDCYEFLYKEITENFGKKSYGQLLKSYIAINRVYDLCIEILSRYFDSVELEQKKGKKSPEKK